MIGHKLAYDYVYQKVKGPGIFSYLIEQGKLYCLILLLYYASSNNFAMADITYMVYI